MPVNYSEFEAMKSFVDFNDADVENLKALAPLVESQGKAITDHFYETLGAVPETAKIIEGRVEALKRTHQRYMMELVAGEYGEAYFEGRSRIGQVHVKMGIDPRFVEGVMSVIRTGILAALAESSDDPADVSAKAGSFIKLCDLDLAVINLAYSEERLDKFSEFTGMSRRLIENVIKI